MKGTGMARGVNKVILIGNLGADPETRSMPSGVTVANIRVATSENWKDKQSGEQKERTEWHSVAMFGRLGEIAGEYFLSNSNLVSHQLRVHVNPTESISTGLLLFDYKFDNPETAGVISDDIATELNWYMDWSVNDHFTLSFVAAYNQPGDAVEEAFGRDENFYYGMVYIAYSY